LWTSFHILLGENVLLKQRLSQMKEDHSNQALVLIKHENLIEKLKQQNAELAAENQKLRDRVTELEKSLFALQARLDKQDLLIEAYDLAQMFNFYVLQTTFGKSWQGFRADMGNEKKKSTYKQWLESCNAKLNLNVENYVAMVSERHNSVHKDLTFPDDQQQFLESFRSCWSSKLETLLPEYKSTIETILSTLQSVKLRELQQSNNFTSLIEEEQSLYLIRRR